MDDLPPLVTGPPGSPAAVLRGLPAAGNGAGFLTVFRADAGAETRVAVGGWDWGMVPTLGLVPPTRPGPPVGLLSAEGTGLVVPDLRAGAAWSPAVPVGDGDGSGPVLGGGARADIGVLDRGAAGPGPADDAASGPMPTSGLSPDGYGAGASPQAPAGEGDPISGPVDASDLGVGRSETGPLVAGTSTGTEGGRVNALDDADWGADPAADGVRPAQPHPDAGQGAEANPEGPLRDVAQLLTLRDMSPGRAVPDGVAVSEASADLPPVSGNVAPRGAPVAGPEREVELRPMFDMSGARGQPGLALDSAAGKPGAESALGTFAPVAEPERAVLAGQTGEGKAARSLGLRAEPGWIPGSGFGSGLRAGEGPGMRWPPVPGEVVESVAVTFAGPIAGLGTVPVTTARGPVAEGVPAAVSDRLLPGTAGEAPGPATGPVARPVGGAVAAASASLKTSLPGVADPRLDGPSPPAEPRVLVPTRAFAGRLSGMATETGLIAGTQTAPQTVAQTGAKRDVRPVVVVSLPTGSGPAPVHGPGVGVAAGFHPAPQPEPEPPPSLQAQARALPLIGTREMAPVDVTPMPTPIAPAQSPSHPPMPKLHGTAPAGGPQAVAATLPPVDAWPLWIAVRDASTTDRSGPEEGAGLVPSGLVGAAGPGTVQRGAGPGLPASVARQIAAALADPGREPGGPIDLALDPPELGRVRLSFVEVNGALSLTIAVDRPETADLMRRHIALLAEEFARAGLDAPSVNISQGRAEGRPGNGAEPGRANGATAGIPPTEALTAQIALPDPARSPARDGLDLRL